MERLISIIRRILFLPLFFIYPLVVMPIIILPLIIYHGAIGADKSMEYWFAIGDKFLE